ncbi:hypothetical protein PVAP13_4NG046022 [Panicum virgatum]|uniref:Uncharacterized protein n=1 Tax=Panicum virgatum TaxID=38727 RepID=A0A8T0TBC9_PANVG|nr:hypothetical protein PVAP13_4NG046022 [Panicum virgatum]
MCAAAHAMAQESTGLWANLQCEIACLTQSNHPLPRLLFSLSAGWPGGGEGDERRVRQVPSSEFETACAGLACAAHRMSYLFCSLFSIRVKWSF